MRGLRLKFGAKWSEVIVLKWLVEPLARMHGLSPLAKCANPHSRLAHIPQKRDSGRLPAGPVPLFYSSLVLKNKGEETW